VTVLERDALAAMAGVPSSRRISAGIEAPPAPDLPAWWGADDWLDEVAAALEERPELLADHHVSRDAVVKLARVMAAFADFRTGRRCRPTNERLVELCQCSLSTVQRARRVLKALELVVERVRGRSAMTRAERLAAWRRGSAHRRVAAEFALCSRPRRAPKVSASLRGMRTRLGCASPHPVERDTPPGAAKESGYLSKGRTHLRRRTETRRGGKPPAHIEGVAPRGLEPAVRRLAEQVRGRLSWLRDTSPSRIAPTLARFGRAGWTVRDVDLAVRDALGARGHRVPRDLKQPAAYLAYLLRELDPADRPTALEDALRAAEKAEDAYRLQLATGAPCPHGMPAGDVSSPLRGLMACPLCRAAAAAAVTW